MHARGRLALDPTRLDWAALQLFARAKHGYDTRPFVFRPYRGLLAFDARHAPFFHGRQAERRQIRECLEALVREGKPRLVIVAGASGTGKSSLVHAGAVPDILASQPGRWEHAVLRPGDDPLGALEAALAARRDPARPLLLVVDQLEELFTHTKDRGTRRDFAQRLWALVGEDTGVSCILSLRIDFLGRCGELRLDPSGGPCLDAVAYDQAHRVFVAQMPAAQLEQAIALPAQQVGLVLPEGLARRIVSEVGSEPGALPLVQTTLDLMWQHRDGRALSIDVYEALGGVTGALERRAEALIEALSDDELRHARFMLTQLVGLGEDDAGDTRRHVPVEQLWPDDPRQRATAEGVLRRFVEERLVVRDDRNRSGATVEISHEALIRRWDRLREWLGDERERRVGRYVVLDKLVERRREQVLLAYDPEMDRRVTIRLLRVGRGGERERARLREQGRALARFVHPNAQAVYDVGVARGHVYMAMEPVEGPSIRDWHELGAQPWHAVVERFVQIADALAAAHELGLLHRAFDANAIRIDAHGVPRVVGFSLDRTSEPISSSRSDQTLAARLEARQSGPLPAAVAPGRSEALPSIDASAVVSMTVSRVTEDMAYTPPEVLRGLPPTPASDQFGYCMSLYEVLMGETPLSGRGIAGFAQAVAAGAPSTRRSAAIPKAVYEALTRGLASDPAERWPSMAALRDALQAVVPAHAKLATVMRTKDSTGMRRAWGLALAAAVGAAAGALLVIATTRGGDAPASAGLEDPARPEAGELPELLSEARARLRDGDAKGAEERAQSVLDRISAGEHEPLRVDALLVRGAARTSLGREREGTADLEQALGLALELEVGSQHPALEHARAWLGRTR